MSVDQCLSELRRTVSSHGKVTSRTNHVCRKPKGHRGPCTGMSRTGPINWRLPREAGTHTPETETKP